MIKFVWLIFVEIDLLFKFFEFKIGVCKVNLVSGVNVLVIGFFLILLSKVFIFCLFWVIKMF